MTTNAEFYQSVLNFHTERLIKCRYKDEAVFHWRQILYYNNDFSEQTGGAELTVDDLYKQAKQSLPLLAQIIDKYNLKEEG